MSSSSIAEKAEPQATNIENKITDVNTENDIRLYSPREVARVVRKLDLHLLSLCFLLYTFSVLDRSNLGNARTAGLKDDIDLSGDNYELLGVAFYAAYIVFQFTSLGWKVFQPHIWVTCVVIFWGTVSTLQATTSSWGGLFACRFILGVAETMFGPGMPLYLSFFYPREYMGLRFGIFLSGAALANAYGGALAYGISQAHSSISNWRFLFIIEGVPTVLLAVVTFFYLPDRPETARFLNVREREVAAALAKTQPGNTIDKAGLQPKLSLEAFKDYRNYLFALANFSTNVSFASLPLFLPTIISEMGSFSVLEANAYSAPPYLVAFVSIISMTFLSDRYGVRGPFAVFFALVAAAGYLILALTTDTAPRYAGIFLVVLIFTTVAFILVWNANSNETESKRAGGVWIVQCVGQCGTLLGTHIFPADEKPYYRKGMWIGFAFSLLAATACATLSFSFWRDNKRRDQESGNVDATGDNVERRSADHVNGARMSIIATTLGQPTFVSYFALDTRSNAASLTGAINGLFQAGGLIGTLCSSFLADSLGRRKAILIAAIVTVIGGALQAGSVAIAMYIVMRLVTGWGIGSTCYSGPCVHERDKPAGSSRATGRDARRPDLFWLRTRELGRAGQSSPHS
ncbi:hypothetical protein LTR17_007922 [Elasticomyces elasticus]|nr:hypothetical protein LTR17_007922 [Elasticomyces elasticus]